MNFNLIDGNVRGAETVTSNNLGFSVEQVSVQTTLSKAYLRKKIKEGDLKATYFGRRVVILREDLEAFLKKGSK